MATEWKNWEEVTLYNFPGRKIFRASAPNYAGKDETQHLTETAVKFIAGKGINGIISFCSKEYTPKEKAILTKYKIRYCWLPVVDYTAQTMDQFKAALKFHRDDVRNAVTLIHCGFGKGRTGTGVTALQLVQGGGDRPLRDDWGANHIEKKVQWEALDEWVKRIKAGRV